MKKLTNIELLAEAAAREVLGKRRLNEAPMQELRILYKGSITQDEDFDPYTDDETPFEETLFFDATVHCGTSHFDLTNADYSEFLYQLERTFGPQGVDTQIAYDIANEIISVFESFSHLAGEVGEITVAVSTDGTVSEVNDADGIEESRAWDKATGKKSIKEYDEEDTEVEDMEGVSGHETYVDDLANDCFYCGSTNTEVDNAGDVYCKDCHSVLNNGTGAGYDVEGEGELFESANISVNDIVLNVAKQIQHAKKMDNEELVEELKNKLRTWFERKGFEWQTNPQAVDILGECSLHESELKESIGGVDLEDYNNFKAAIKQIVDTVDNLQVDEMFRGRFNARQIESSRHTAVLSHIHGGQVVISVYLQDGNTSVTVDGNSVLDMPTQEVTVDMIINKLSSAPDSSLQEDEAVSVDAQMGETGLEETMDKLNRLNREADDEFMWDEYRYYNIKKEIASTFGPDVAQLCHIAITLVPLGQMSRVVESSIQEGEVTAQDLKQAVDQLYSELVYKGV